MNEAELNILWWIREHLTNPFLDTVMPYISSLANHGEFWIVLAVILLCFKKTRKAGVAMGLAMACGYLIGKDHIVTGVKDGEISFSADATGIVSVFCMGRDATGVTIDGLQYALENGALSAGFPLGVSNHFVGKDAKIAVKDGSLLVIYDRNNGITASP